MSLGENGLALDVFTDDASELAGARPMVARVPTVREPFSEQHLAMRMLMAAEKAAVEAADAMERRESSHYIEGDTSELLPAALGAALGVFRRSVAQHATIAGELDLVAGSAIELVAEDIAAVDRIVRPDVDEVSG